MKKKNIYILLLFLCFLVYANSLKNEFVSDDLADIVTNQFIAYPFNVWLVPHNFLNSLCYLAGKLNPIPYHLVSIVVHYITTILVFFFLKLFFKERGSLLGACLFAVHPIHAEAVTWVSGRPYAILGLFVLTTFFLYYRATRFAGGPGIVSPQAGDTRSIPDKIDYRFYAASVAVYAYYLYNNYAFYFLFPVFLILFDVTFERARKAFIWWMPYVIILIARLSLSKIAVATRVQSVAKEMGGTVVWTNPLFNMTYSFFCHCGLLIWPYKLTLYHEPPVITMFWLRAGIVGLIILAGMLPFLFKKKKELFFALCLFGLFLAPTYSPVTISWLLAERYLYVPSISLSIGFAFVYERYFARIRRLRRIGLSLCLMIIAAYAVRTVVRNEDWKTPERLWRSSVQVSPFSPRAHNNMGDVYARQGSFEWALKEFKKAVELKPGYADPYHNLGNIYDVLGNTDEAEKFYLEAIRINPDLYQSYRNLGIIYLKKGQTELGQEYLQKGTEKKTQEIIRGYPAQIPVRGSDPLTKRGLTP